MTVREHGDDGDVTLQLEASLRESEERLRLAAANANVGMFDLDLVTRTWRWTDRMRTLCGLPPDAPVPDDIFAERFVHPEDAAAVRARMIAAIARTSDGAYANVHRIVRLDGEVRWVQVRSQTYFEGAGDARRAVRVLGAMIDVTEHKRVEQELRESEERLRLAAEAMTGLIYDWDVATGAVHRSGGVGELLGDPSAAQLDVHQWVARLHPEDGPVVRQRFEQAVAARAASLSVEYRFRHHAGHYVWLWDHARLLHGPGGVQRCVGHVVSIDDTKRAQARVAFLERLHPVLVGERDPVVLVQRVLQALAEHCAVDLAAVGEFAVDGQTITVQRAFRDRRPSVLGPRATAGYLDEETLAAVLSGTSLAIDDVATDPRTAPRAAAFRAHDVAALLVVPLVSTAGPRAVVTLNARVPRRWHADEIQLLRDVAERLFPAIERARAEASLRASERRLALALEAGNAGAWEIDLGTGATIVDERVPALVRRQEPGPTTGSIHAWMERVHAEDRARVAAQFADAAREAGGPHDAEVRVRCGDGVDRWFATRGIVVDEDGRHRMLGVIQDITERKLAEQALRDADRRKDEFMAMLGHELRNPLAAIRSAAEVLQLAGTDDPRRARAHAVLERQTHHMTRLVDGLLEVSRIARGKIFLDPQTVDLREIVESVLHDRAAQIAERGLALRSELPADPLWVTGDPARLVQVFDNLVGNAVKFTDPPGTIAVVLAVDDGAALVRVHDTGIGIRPEMLPHVFDPFQQDAQDIARADGGLGLGLSLARGLVELHRGSIEAHSAGTGAGSELRVRLPIAAPPAPRPASRRAAPTPPTRVLVVEDNADVAQMLCDVLEPGGHQVRVAAAGPDALAILRTEPIEVVLCDIGLPGMDGFELARQVRADPALRDVTMFAMTGYGQPEDLARTRAAGFDGHLTKPIDVGTLDEVIARRRPPTPA